MLTWTMAGRFEILLKNAASGDCGGRTARSSRRFHNPMREIEVDRAS